jgi:hypothetical protein
MRINKKVADDLANLIQERYDIDVKDYQSFLQLQYDIDEALLARYFGDTKESDEAKNYWKQHLKFGTRKTGQQLLDKINALQKQSKDPLEILDVGCGDNEWKEHFGEQLIGIDPFNKNADVQLGIEQFAKERPFASWDVVLVLGSINFGDQTTIESQLVSAASLVKPGGKLFLRANPGITHVNEHAQWIDFFNWSKEYIIDVSERLNFKVNEIGWDHPTDAPDTPNGNRYYSEWTKHSI